MATWNGAPTLAKVLEACCRLAPPEGGRSLLVDDGCTDGTGEVLAGFSARLPLRIVTQERRGRNAALNLALQPALANHDADARMRRRREVEARHTPQLLDERVRAFYAGLLP